jgi:hypothetical protein
MPTRPLRRIPGVASVAAAFWCAATPVRAQAPFRATTPSIPSLFRPLAAFDADGDGDRDLFGPSGLYLNDGTGRYAPLAGALPIAAQIPLFARAADFDGDGDQDLVTVGSAGIRLNYNGGGGVFGPAIAPTGGGAGGIAAAFAGELVVGDFDADGRFDVAAPSNGFRLLLQVSPGVFTDATATILSLLPPGAPELLTGGDLDADGVPELLLDVGQTPVVVRRALGAFTAAVVPGGAGGQARSATAGDFDGDGRIDFAVSRGGSGTAANDEFVLQPGATPFAIVHSRAFPARLGAIDFGADGRDDLLRSTAAGATLLDYLTGAPLPAPRLVDDLPTLAAPGGLIGPGARFVVFDANGDSRDDLAGLVDVADYGVEFGTAAAFVSASDGLPSAYLSPQFNNAAQTVAADFDGDGDLDLARAVKAGGASSLELRRNDARGRFGAPVVGGLEPETNTTRFVVADFDADGNADAVQLTIGEGPKHHRQSPPGFFTATSSAALVAGVTAATATDFDGDGDVDVTFSGTVAIGFGGTAQGLFVLVNTAGVLSAPAPLGVASTHLRAEPMHADGDAVPDYVLASVVAGSNPTTVQYAVYSGAAGALLAVLGTLPANPGLLHDFAVGDLNGDGADDVLADGVAWLGGAANFAATTSPFPLVTPTSQRRRYFRDFDADGVLDAAEIDSFAVHVAFGSPTGGFAPATSETLNYGFAIEVLADLDRDGDVDLVDRVGRIMTGASAGLTPGVPAILGRTASFDVHGPTGAPFELFAATAAFVQTPVAIPNFGNLWLDPNAAVYVGPGVCAAGAPTRITIAVPNLPALAGLTLWWQTVLPIQTRLSNALATPIFAP